MRLFNKVAVVGIGLIGGSLAAAIKKKRLAQEVLGVSRHKKTLLLAKKSGLIDKGSQDIHIIKDADLVILATPVETIMNLAPVIARIIRPGCIVIDVGSTKQEIVSKLGKFFAYYVGSHPLAGSEKRGILNAHPDIFKNSLCILTPTKNTHKGALEKIKRFWQALDTKVILLRPGLHDRILSGVSHLPHIVAFSLINSIPKKYLKFSSTGLKATTRIALSDHKLWADIFLSNQKNTLKAIDSFGGHLRQVKSAIQRKDRRLLSRILKKAKAKRKILS